MTALVRTSLAWPFLLACGPTNASSVHDTTVGTTLASDVDIPADVGCECIRPGEPEVEAYDSDACGWGPCGTIELECADLSSVFSECPAGRLVLDIAAVDCALELLRAGTPGTVHFDESEDRHYSGKGGFLRLRGDRTGLARTWDWVDVGGTSTELTVVTLRDPAYFAGCRALQDPYDRFQCLKDWSQGQSLTVCDGPINYEP